MSCTVRIITAKQKLLQMNSIHNQSVFLKEANNCWTSNDTNLGFCSCCICFSVLFSHSQGSVPTFYYNVAFIFKVFKYKWGASKENVCSAYILWERNWERKKQQNQWKRDQGRVSFKMAFFASLHFLRDNITPRKTTSNLETDISQEKENEAVDQGQPSQQATQQVPDDGCVQGSVFPIDNPPSVKTKKESISILLL